VYNRFYTGIITLQGFLYHVCRHTGRRRQRAAGCLTGIFPPEYGPARTGERVLKHDHRLFIHHYRVYAVTDVLSKGRVSVFPAVAAAEEAAEAVPEVSDGTEACCR
jgi:hypothetical protein